MEQFEDIYNNYAKIVYGFLLKLSHDPSISEDLTQETFLIAIKKIDTYDHKCKISTWLCGIAKKLWIKESQKIKTVDLDEISYNDQYNFETIEVLKRIHNLQEPYKEVIYLRLAANLNFAQIGEIMNQSENWARVTFYRGKNKIKEELL